MISFLYREFAELKGDLSPTKPLNRATSWPWRAARFALWDQASTIPVALYTSSASARLSSWYLPVPRILRIVARELVAIQSLLLRWMPSNTVWRSCLVSPLLEEGMNRWLIQERVLRRWPQHLLQQWAPEKAHWLDALPVRIARVVLTALLFAAQHHSALFRWGTGGVSLLEAMKINPGGAGSLYYLFAAGLTMGWMQEVTHDVRYSVSTHVFHNSSVYLLKALLKPGA